MHVLALWKGRENVEGMCKLHTGMWMWSLLGETARSPASQSIPKHPKHPRATHSIPEQARATQGNRGQPKASQSIPELPKASQSIPEQPKASQSNPQHPRATQSIPKQPRASQSNPSALTKGPILWILITHTNNLHLSAFYQCCNVTLN